jgi:hypothetical protein
MTRVSLLEHRVLKLEATVYHQKKRTKRSRARLQHGGTLEVVEASILRASQSPTEPVSKICRSCEQYMTIVTTLECRVTVLEATVKYQNKRKRQSRARLQTGGVLRVEEAQEVISQARQLIQGPMEEGLPQTRQRAPPSCSNCHQTGHTRTVVL